MLDYRGHFSTKSRRYSTALRVLRSARADWHRRRRLTAHCDDLKNRTIVSVPDLTWAGRGWRTSGDAVLALSAAACSREHERIARDEISAVAS
jgi:hypothetical protein